MTPGGAGKPDTFMVERVQLLSDADVDQCKRMLSKLAYLTAQYAYSSTRADKIKWQDEMFTPLHAKKARKLSASPTDASLPP